MAPEDQSFMDVLNVKAEDVKAPPAHPEGHYVLVIKGHTFGRTSTEKKTPYVQFSYTFSGPCADVDPESMTPELEEALLKKKMSKRFWTTPDALSRVVSHLKLAGMELGDLTVLDLIKSCEGHEIIGYLQVEESKDAEGEYYNTLRDKFVSITNLDAIG